MHGVIFTSLRHFANARLGAAHALELWRDEPAYLITGAYPDEEFLRLFRRVAEAAAADEEVLLRDFGVFAAGTTFGLLYPSFFDQARSARDFMLSVEERIHEVVRATLADAQPPRLHVRPLGEDGVHITYDSPRRLCALLAGLAIGATRRLGERVMLTETSCMHRGDAACEFELRFAPGRPA